MQGVEVLVELQFIEKLYCFSQSNILPFSLLE